MDSPFDRESFVGTMSLLPQPKRRLFLYSVCQRLRPGFAEFAKETGHPGLEVIDLSLDSARRFYLENQSADWPRLSQDCEAIAPDTERFQSDYTSTALDCAVSTSYLMKSFIQDDIDLVSDGTSLVIDSVDMWIQILEGVSSSTDDIERLIKNHVLMKTELERQKADFEFLMYNNDLASTFSYFESENKSCIGIA